MMEERGGKWGVTLSVFGHSGKSVMDGGMDSRRRKLEMRGL